MRFHHRLGEHKLADGILETVNDLLRSQGLLLKHSSAVNATLIGALGSTNNKDGKRDPEMHLSKTGNQLLFGMKTHISVDAESSLVHTVCGTADHVAEVTDSNNLLHGKETVVFADAGYRGTEVPTSGPMPRRMYAGR